MEYDCMATASRSMPAMSKTEEICDNLAGEAARHLNCMSGMLTKASAATSKYFIKQDSDTTWSYGFRVLVGMLLLLALFFLAKNQQVQRMVGESWQTSLYYVYSHPDDVHSRRG
ncbi:hypothetical protein EB796_011380 [Bugula neritina]|uniref:Uncharacterized protein n=1 Tax=Bugula neritina TaxID=10212 RepID=A0A7J7JV75_BUGNE|nr:hypothetical protein EB796_011380 [Bugula neritina]